MNINASGLLAAYFRCGDDEFACALFFNFILLTEFMPASMLSTHCYSSYIGHAGLFTKSLHDDITFTSVRCRLLVITPGATMLLHDGKHYRRRRLSSRRAIYERDSARRYARTPIRLGATLAYGRTPPPRLDTSMRAPADEMRFLRRRKRHRMPPTAADFHDTIGRGHAS